MLDLAFRQIITGYPQAYPQFINKPAGDRNLLSDAEGGEEASGPEMAPCARLP